MENNNDIFLKQLFQAVNIREKWFKGLIDNDLTEMIKFYLKKFMFREQSTVDNLR